MLLDRDTIASTLVASGGAWVLGSALLHSRSGKWSSAQRRGLVYAGVGFLMSAAAARWLQHTGNRGVAISIAGTIFAMRGMYILLRERALQSAVTRPPKPPTSD